MLLSRFDKLADQYHGQQSSFVRVLDEECIPRVDVFFLQNPNDHLRLSFPMLIRPC